MEILYWFGITLLCLGGTMIIAILIMMRWCEYFIGPAEDDDCHWEGFTPKRQQGIGEGTKLNGETYAQAPNRNTDPESDPQGRKDNTKIPVQYDGGR